jgi:hypothetical protein
MIFHTKLSIIIRQNMSEPEQKRINRSADKQSQNTLRLSLWHSSISILVNAIKYIYRTNQLGDFIRPGNLRA